MSNLTDEKFKEQTIVQLTALTEQNKHQKETIDRIPQIEKDLSKVLGILEGKESMVSRTRANVALWIAAGVAIFGEAGSKILSLFK